ncbi:MAG: TIGR04255 family protein [Chloroflexota bacterium]
MTIKFPSKPDIPLKNAPLVEVVCQVRFPPILRINTEEPSEFQEEIRDRFPKIEIEQGILLRLPVPGSGGVPSAEAQGKMTYRFRTKDEGVTVSLASDFFALSTTQYKHWRDFSKYLRLVDKAVQHVYRPSFATRIGLRFINRITPHNTGLQDLTDIMDLLNPDLIGFVRSDVWSTPVEMETRLLLSDEDARLNLRIGYGKDKENTPFLLLDFDCFEARELPLSNLIERCDGYHDVIYRSFRWCIPDEKLNVFGPVVEDT